MRFRRSACLLVALSTLFVTREDADAQDRRAIVVVSVGPRKVTVGELEDRLAAVPRFQLATFGDSPDAIKRRFVSDVIVPELLLSLGAEDKRIDKELPTSFSLERTISESTMRAVRAEIGAASAIPMADVEKYYQENRAHFDAPERYGIWRIVVKTKDAAQSIVDQMKRDKSADAWTRLAREKSVDKGTSLRGGNLGFVSLDGTSNEAGVKVDPAIPKAAAQVKDDEIAGPVGEGENFAVVWRRSTIGASRRTVEEAAAQIRDSLWKQRVERAQKQLLKVLRERDVKELNESRLGGLEISVTNGSIAPRGRPGQVPPQ